MSGLYPKADDELPSQPNSPIEHDENKEIKKTQQIESHGPVPKYEGEPGPTEKRSCQDIFFLILFALFWVGMIVVAAVAIKEGNLNRLKYGNDTEGNLCGVSNPGGRDLTGSPYQYIFNPTDFNSYRKCVPVCPDTFGKVICAYDIANVPDLSSNASAQELAQFYLQYKDNCTITLETKEVLNRCIPNPAQFARYLNSTSGSTSNLIDQYKETKDTATQIFSDIYDAWQVILICSVVALVASFLWLFLVQWFAPLMVWVTLIFVNLVGLGFMGFMWYNWKQVHDGNEANQYIVEYAPSGTYNEKTILAISIFVSIVVLFVFFLTLGLRKRISLAIGLIQETSKAVRKMPLIVFFPIFKYVALALLSAWVIYVWALLATSGTVQAELAGTASQKLQYNFQPNRIFQFLTIYYALGFFWTFNWIIAIAQTTIAGSIASWYWARDKNAIPSMPVWTAFKRTMRYHLGSLAFGSLIIAIVQTIRLVLTYMQTQLHKRKESKIAQYILTCLQCCFACVEKILKFLNKNAYIEIAIYGYTFCEGSKAAFQLLVRNAVRIVVVDKIGDFLFFLGKLLITMITCIVGAAMLKSNNPDDTSRFWAVPLIIIAIMAYVIASCFMAVFDMAINTIFLCFCEDSERNDGQGKPYYMPESLKKFIDESGKAKPNM